ncbi:MAG TPA: DUF5335 family protein [Thermoanaerobaculia bacterium]|nr:DUF5335 family protein [Thermoanaerobaculia bacterium]
MHTRTIPREFWRQELDGLSRAYDGALVSIEVVGADVGAQPAVIEQPLRGISADRRGVTISIARLDHHMPHPHQVRIVEADEGAIMAVEIEEQEGTHTLLHFRSPARPELFDAAVE